MKTYSIEVLFVPDDLSPKQLKKVGELSLIKEFHLYPFWGAVRDTFYGLHGRTVVHIIDDSTKTVVYQGLSVNMLSWVERPKMLPEWKYSCDQYYAENA